MEDAARARREGRLEDAYRGYIQAADVCRACQERRSLISALKGVGQIERDRGHLDAAFAAYEEAVALAREEGDPLLLAHALRHAGDILRHLRRLSDAELRCAEALGIYRERSNAPRVDLANAIRSTAVLKEDIGANAEALSLWQEAQQIYSSLGVQAGVDECRAYIAGIARRNP